MLNKKCEEYNSSFKTIFKDCLETNDYAVHTRCPFYEDLTEGDGLLAIKSAEKVKEFITEKIV